MPHRVSKQQPQTPAKGLYANYFEVGHTAFEVVIDFGLNYAGTPPTACHTRIVTSPVYAEALLDTLRDALQQYRGRFDNKEPE